MNSASLFKRTAVGGAILLASAAFSLGASAAALTVTFDNPIFGLTSDNPRSDLINLTTYDSGQVSRSIRTNAGRFTGVASEPTSDFKLGLLVDLDIGEAVRFAMYCYDLDQYISGGDPVRYTVEFDDELQRTRDFLGAVNAELNKDKSGNAVDPYAWLRPGSALAGAAIQIGIWESLYDTNSDWNIANGNFQVQANDLEAKTSDWLNQFFARLNNKDFLALSPESVIVLRSDSKQDMITGDPPGKVPEPGSLALVAAAGLGLMATRRRRAAK